MRLYRKAYAINPDLEILLKSIPQEVFFPKKEDTCVSKPKIPFQVAVPGALEEIRASGLDNYTPLDVPEDVLMHILACLGSKHLVSLERCAASCKKMYIASRSSTVWQRIVADSRAAVISRFSSSVPKGLSYRQLYFSLPKVRTDGVYICKITYLRPGATEGSYYQPTHLVTYFRYLRFLGPEYGQAIIFAISLEDPKNVIPLLRDPFAQMPTLNKNYIPVGSTAKEILRLGRKRPNIPGNMAHQYRHVNLFVGKYWRSFADEELFRVILYDPVSRSSNSIFDMEIKVSCRLGKREFIKCLYYSSVSQQTCFRNLEAFGGEDYFSVYEFRVSDWGKFIFSRVKSYIT
jgi:hypothetical protein